MKIYTKKGDQGYTSNIKGEPIKKSEALLELQGTIDEANAAIGYLRSLMEGAYPDLEDGLRDIQYALFRMGSDVTYGFTQKLIIEEDVSVLETEIDRMTGAFGVQTTFLYYSGHQTATYAQLARSIIRRGERAFVRAYVGDDYPMDLKYLNRLADYMYALGRYLNHIHGVVEEKMTIRDEKA
ncbi:cob(I)yrinic acid a,c-diamide adenosyltransferase [Petrocella sp. FN5]|uniref:cob(I)yrinic acid a,c-diamide adenosyltransferase n=1 Tax=Petrocella sp. FN5 TaxID=3032002 RepID=UPI0023DC9647|nr:cob(I)yrinic acid a,c-diamide adenosyltransferase [Petrocella sp. FN5]MDF1616636.1 cob(I)yrinic acid a,c-diamide adenosyltransferase [Petrocella sp. FN5]